MMSRQVRKFILTILSFVGYSVACASDSLLLLGKSNELIRRHLEFKVDCVSDTTGIASIESGKFNSVFFAPISNGYDIELVFDGCSGESKLVALTFSMDKLKAESLERLYNDIYGKQSSSSKGARRHWLSNQYEIVLSHVFDERYALTLGCTH